MSHKRKDLSEFNWSDDMIEQYSFGDDSILQNVIPPNTEPKQRPIELNRRLDPSSVKSHLKALEKSKYVSLLSDEERERRRRNQRLEAMELSKSLNQMTQDWLSSVEGEAVANHIPFIPLNIFNDSDYERKSVHEMVRTAMGSENEEEEEEKFSDLALPAVGLFLPTPSDTFDGGLTPFDLAFGEWRRCHVVSFEPSSESFEVCWSDGGSYTTLKSPEILLEDCGESRFHHFEKYQASMTKRRDVESLLRYQLFIDSMPDDGDLISPFPSDQAERIKEGTFLPIHHLLSQTMWDEYVDTLVTQEVGKDYARTMNTIIFDSNMINETNIQTYFDLALPIPPPSQPPPLLGEGEHPLPIFQPTWHVIWWHLPRIIPNC